MAVEGNGFGIGAGIVPSSGGKPVDVIDWDEFRPSLATNQQESQWGLTDAAVNTSRASADSNGCFEGSCEIFNDVPPTEENSREEEGQRGEKNAGRDDTKTAGEGASGLNRIVGGGEFAPCEIEEGVHGKQGTRVGEAVAATAIAEAQGDDGATPTANRGEHDGGVPRSVDAGVSDTARPDDGDVQGGSAITASNGPERPPCSTATRCLSYTVKFPWDGLK